MKKSQLRKIIEEEIKLITEANTPWGKSDVEYPIERGVVWYGTPGHGGLGVAAGIAKKKLSPQALGLGEYWGGTYWYEEDIAWAIPMYENPDWDKKLAKLSGGRTSSKSDLEKDIKRWFPEYFEKSFAEKSKSNLSIPALEIKDVVTLYGKDEYQIIGNRGNGWIIADISHPSKIYKLSKIRISKDATKIERAINGKLETIWEKK